ncbi:SixA phosphatase family protein [Photobacterium sp.]|uniref:SixA phosphatase family protein n=1 Tax=Photobacterium sp. TaxID=660 RepID=UPI00299DAD89|nr:histidine phosphatase family protein [Photobacterium sp.]MDX1301447.1 histidine phosphatase family protein [Photobacterium sp.]
MKQLFLLRHAKSSWDDPTLDDHDRPLNKRGMRNASAMVERLNALLATPQRVVTSSAIRAQQTAHIFAQGLANTPELEISTELYTESAFELLAQIKATDDRLKRVMMVCHNPAINDLMNMLGFEIENVPTCGIIVFGFNVSSWQELGNGKVIPIYYDYPKRLKS